MKSYGHDRHEKLTCKYGCCDFRKGSKYKDAQKLYAKRAKHRARQAGKKDAGE